MKHIFLIATILVCISIALFISMIVVVVGRHNSAASELQSQRLCRQYADRDHEKELAPERWQWFLDQGINPNTDFDWYQSCLDHINYPVAGDR